MTSAITSRTSAATSRKSIHALEQTNLGVEQSEEAEQPVEGSGYPTGHVGAGLLLGVGGDILHLEGQHAPLQGTPYLPRRSTHRPWECSVHSESLLVPRQRLVYHLH